MPPIDGSTPSESPKPESSAPWKKLLSWAIRILAAAAGVTYIVVALNWSDTVTLPAGYDLPGTVSEVGAASPSEPATYRLEAHDAQAGVYRLAMPQADGGEVFLEVLVTEVTDAPETPTFNPGVVTMLSGAKLPMLLAGLLLFGLILPLQTKRWQMLMHCRGITPSYGKTFRLVMVGMFFNICLPGSTGGDVVKAYYAARGTDQRASAVMSVIFDRVLGMLALILLGGLVGLTLLDDARLGRVIAAIWIGLAGLLSMGVIYFTPPIRRVLGVDMLLRNLPGKGMIAKIDAAATAYRGYAKTLLIGLGLSLIVHTLIVLSVAMAGWALGMTRPLQVLGAVLPIVMLTQAIPLFPMGLGVADAAAVQLLVEPGQATVNQVIGMMLLQRLFLVFYALCGSVVLIRGNYHLHHDDDIIEPGEPKAESSPG